MPHNKDFYNPDSAEYHNPAAARKVAIVTGGNSGIGWYTVLHLYLHGYIVYVAGRNPQKVARAIADITAEAAKRAGKYSDAEQNRRFLGELVALNIDCCDLASVAKCAAEFSAREAHLDVLINNAGVMAVPFEMTTDGYEVQYQVNLVAPFLLTMELLPALEKAATPASAPRVVTLSSIGHNLSMKYWAPSDPINKFPSALYSWVRYGNAKRGAIEFMSRFATEFPRILSFSVHPGVITDTRLYDWWTNMPVFGPVVKIGLQGCNRVMGVTGEEGALATLRAALDPELGAKESGSYLVTGGSIENASSVARNRDNINSTWAYLKGSLAEKGFLKQDA